MTSFQRWSIVLYGIAVVSIGFSIISGADKTVSVEFIKYGLSSITTLSGTALQGVRYIRKNKLVELQFCVNIVDRYEALEEFDKKIVNNALDGIFSK